MHLCPKKLLPDSLHQDNASVLCTFRKIKWEDQPWEPMGGALWKCSKDKFSEMLRERAMYRNGELGIDLEGQSTFIPIGSCHMQSPLLGVHYNWDLVPPRRLTDESRLAPESE